MKKMEKFQKKKDFEFFKFTFLKKLGVRFNTSNPCGSVSAACWSLTSFVLVVAGEPERPADSGCGLPARLHSFQGDARKGNSPRFFVKKFGPDTF